MKPYPIFLRLVDRRCVVAGGGRVAFGKARSLHAAGARLVIVSPAFALEFDSLPGIERHTRPFAPEDLDGAFLAVAATDDPAVNRRVAELCRARGILCNVVDAPDLCDFYVPSVVERGRLTVALSTSGEAPALSKRLRRELEAQWPEDYADYVRFLGRARRRIRDAVKNRGKREEMAAALASPEGYTRFAGATPVEREAWLMELLREADTGDTDR